ncbi:MAG: IclR family transcriptional regulator [Verrucomicrobia bacterium]|nr:IclR family transcriptional regulator [Verrucomicrobiota bacterium]
MEQEAVSSANMANEKKAVAKGSVAVRDSGVQTPALDRALALLEYISAQSEGVTAAQIRSALGFSANLVFRLTRALMVHGYIERDLTGRRFLLSQKMLMLAQPKKEERSLGQMAWPTLCWLRDRTGESAHIGIRAGFECVVLERVIGLHLFKFYVEAGARGPLHAGAPGKAMLAWLPEEELRRTLKEMSLGPLTKHTITSKEDFERELQEVKKKGYAMDLGETLDGLHCLGAPIWNAEGRVCASVWITSPAPRLDKAAELEHAPVVIEAANRISDILK